MSAPVDVLAVMDGCIAHAEKMIACLRHEGNERFAKQWDAEVIRQRAARAAVAELIEAGNSLLDAYKPVTDTFNIIPPQVVAQRKVRLRAALARVQGEGA